jgi:hypothetical protein
MVKTPCLVRQRIGVRRTYFQCFRQWSPPEKMIQPPATSEIFQSVVFGVETFHQLSLSLSKADQHVWKISPSLQIR